MFMNMNIERTATMSRALHPLQPYNATSFSPKPYVVTMSTEMMHHFSRFGHTNNFDAIVEGVAGDGDMAKNYIIGYVSCVCEMQYNQQNVRLKIVCLESEYSRSI